jgi:hypothetical protein
MGFAVPFELLDRNQGCEYGGDSSIWFRVYAHKWEDAVFPEILDDSRNLFGILRVGHYRITRRIPAPQIT